MTEKNRSLIPGFMIIALGIILLLHNTRIIPRLEDFIGSLFFLCVAFLCYRVFKQNPKHFWALLVASFCFLFGIALLCKTFNLLGGDLLGAAFFWCIAFAFGYVYYDDKKRWWSIIPAGACITLGAIALLDALDITKNDYNGVVFFLGIGLTFVYLWTLADAANQLKWARFPAIACLFMSLFVFLETVANVGFTVIVSVIFILAGIMILTRAFKRR